MFVLDVFKLLFCNKFADSLERNHDIIIIIQNFINNSQIIKIIYLNG